MPAYEWAANPGKTYTLLFVDLTQPLLGRTVFHYLAYNVRNGAAVTKELNTTLGAWRSPGNPFRTPNKYTNLLFEHDGDLAFNKSVAAEMVASSAPPFNLTTFMGVLGLDNAKLVSVNWMLVINSIVSRQRLGAANADKCALPGSTERRCVLRGSGRDMGLDCARQICLAAPGGRRGPAGAEEGGGGVRT